MQTARGHAQANWYIHVPVKLHLQNQVMGVVSLQTLSLGSTCPALLRTSLWIHKLCPPSHSPLGESFSFSVLFFMGSA